MKRKNMWIILGALGLNLLFFLILVSMNRTPELKDVQDKLNTVEVWQVQPNEPKIPIRKISEDRPVEKIKKKELKLKTVSLNQEKMKPRRALNIDVQPSFNISDADMVFQADYVPEASPEDKRILELDEVDLLLRAWLCLPLLIHIMQELNGLKAMLHYSFW